MSPSEGSAKSPQIGAFVLDFICTISSVRQVWSHLWSSQVQKALIVAGTVCQRRLRGLLSVRDRTVQTELDVVIDERSKRQHVVEL